MIMIDGSAGEGGGQVLRTSLALSLITGLSFTIENIRAKRSRPGLRRQHLTGVRAAIALGNAETEGAELGSKTLVFRPGAMSAGKYHLDVGSAGSTVLVLQTILPAALKAPGVTEWTIEGGTHNQWAPPFDFLQRAFIPLLAKMGAKVEVTMEKAGFYPRGGGKITARVEPCEHLKQLSLLERGDLLRARSISVLAGKLPDHIALREHHTLKKNLKEEIHGAEYEHQTEKITHSWSAGNVFFLELESEHITEVFTGFGERGRPAEAVAEIVVNDAKPYLRSTAPVGLHLADQLLIPMALAGKGSFKTNKATLHTSTNAAIIERFLPVSITITEGDDGLFLIEIQPRTSA